MCAVTGDLVAASDLHHYPFLEPGTRLQLPGYPLPGFHLSSRYKLRLAGRGRGGWLGK